MTIVLNEMLVVFFNGEVDIHIPFVRAAGHRLKLRQTVETSVLQNYTGACRPCQP